VRILTAHGARTERGVQTGELAAALHICLAAVAALHRPMEGVEEPSTPEEAEVVVQLHSQPSHRTHKSFFLWGISQCLRLSFSSHTLFVRFARLDYFVNVFLLECSGNDDKIILTWC
jgi:hypothetical protein